MRQLWTWLQRNWRNRFPGRMWSCGAGFLPFCKKHRRRVRSLLCAKREPERTAVPAGHESPSGAFKPQTGLRGKVSATFEAREAAGCGSLRLLRALRGTRILQAAAPTAPPCFGRWPRSSPLQTKGCSPLIIPKQMDSIQKIQVAALEDFLCCADFESLTRRTVRASLSSICCATAAG